MYSCIVVVGGGLNFECTQPWLQYCIWKNMPAHFRPMLETMDVITRPKVCIHSNSFVFIVMLYYLDFQIYQHVVKLVVVTGG